MRAAVDLRADDRAEAGQERVLAWPGRASASARTLSGSVWQQLAQELERLHRERCASTGRASAGRAARTARGRRPGPVPRPGRGAARRCAGRAGCARLQVARHQLAGQGAARPMRRVEQGGQGGRARSARPARGGPAPSLEVAAQARPGCSSRRRPRWARSPAGWPGSAGSSPPRRVLEPPATGGRAGEAALSVRNWPISRSGLSPLLEPAEQLQDQAVAEDHRGVALLAFG